MSAGRSDHVGAETVSDQMYVGRVQTGAANQPVQEIRKRAPDRFGLDGRRGIDDVLRDVAPVGRDNIQLRTGVYVRYNGHTWVG